MAKKVSASLPRLLLLVLLAGRVASFGAASRPNILFILADQWRFEACGYAGNADVKTPNLDRLAGEGVSFVNAVSGLPVCSPMRASLLTGQRPLTHGVFLNDVPCSDMSACPETLASTRLPAI